MKLRLHTCKATDCQHVISVRMLMCQEHWDMVPAALRRELIASRMDGHGWGYRDAAARAIAAVEEKQERKAAAGAGPSGSLFT
jgi:hypothetical protein